MKLQVQYFSVSMCFFLYKRFSNDWKRQEKWQKSQNHTDDKYKECIGSVERKLCSNLTTVVTFFSFSTFFACAYTVSSYCYKMSNVILCFLYSWVFFFMLKWDSCQTVVTTWLFPYYYFVNERTHIISI